mgnify:FL=1
MIQILHKVTDNSKTMSFKQHPHLVKLFSLMIDIGALGIPSGCALIELRSLLTTIENQFGSFFQNELRRPINNRNDTVVHFICNLQVASDIDYNTYLDILCICLRGNYSLFNMRNKKHISPVDMLLIQINRYFTPRLINLYNPYYDQNNSIQLLRNFSTLIEDAVLADLKAYNYTLHLWLNFPNSDTGQTLLQTVCASPTVCATVLHFLVSFSGYDNYASLLLREYGASDHIDSFGRLLLHNISKYHKPTIETFEMVYKANPNAVSAQDYGGVNPLQYLLSNTECSIQLLFYVLNRFPDALRDVAK